MSTNASQSSAPLCPSPISRVFVTIGVSRWCAWWSADIADRAAAGCDEGSPAGAGITDQNDVRQQNHPTRRIARRSFHAGGAALEQFIERGIMPIASIDDDPIDVPLRTDNPISSRSRSVGAHFEALALGENEESHFAGPQQ